MPRKRLQEKNPNRRTITDIAEAASVSTATVSRYLNSPDSVRPERAERVRLAIAKQGYVPHGAARALASRRSMTIGAVIPTLDNAIFAKGTESFQRRLHKSGYTLLLANYNYDLDEERRQVTALMERHVDAMSLIGFDHHPETYAQLKQMDIPFVCSWAHGNDDSPPCVGFDNREAMVRLTTYLIEIGHKDIAIIAGHTPSNDRARDRVSGIHDVLTKNDLTLDPQNYVECDYSINEGRMAMRVMMQRTPRPTVVVCGNDVIAFGALLECQSMGISVPEEISITGFDDLPFASHFQPALTTVRVPTEEMGRRTAEHLLSRIDGKTINLRAKLEVELIIRGTTAPPRSKP